MNFTLAEYDEAAAFIRSCTRHAPTVGLVLGSGLGPLAERIEDATAIPYGDVPHFPTSTVPGHSGQLVIGRLRGAAVCCMQGRFHYYEGYSMQQVTLPVRVMARLGVKTLILTNAAGGLNPGFRAGDLMLMNDHIFLPGMAGANPLRGPNVEEFGTRFPAVNHVYTRRLRALAREAAAEAGVAVHEGAYVMVAGPNFESAAEIRMLRGWGGDAVGMSTVPEALVAHHAGLEVLAVSTITNVAIAEGDAAEQPTHEEVMEAGRQIVPRLTALLEGVLSRLAA
jgi:purine-nucleoside phosphorylase